MNSSLFHGYLEHIRHQPVAHRFRYRFYTYAIDLDELPAIANTTSVFGYNRMRPIAIHDRDYLTPTPVSIRSKLKQVLAERGYTDFRRAVLVTTPRYFHYVFNPVSFYYCYAASSELLCCVAEVNNTYGERHLYVLGDAEYDATSSVEGRYRDDKAFFVSPFNRIGGQYEFVFGDIRKRLDITVRLWNDGALKFAARMWGEPVPLTTQNIKRAVVRAPLLPYLTMPLIRFHAMYLWLRRGLPLLDKPVANHPMTIRRRGPTMLQAYCKQQLLACLQRLETGTLRMQLPDGSVSYVGDGPVTAEITIHDNRFFSRTITGGEIGFGESYTAGEWDSPDVTALVRLFIENRHVIDDERFGLAVVSRFINRTRHWLRPNTRRGSRRNIQQHYDLSNDFFALMLDSTMNYSCAFFDSPNQCIEDAQLNKIERLIRKARIRPDSHVLEIGCGWGSFACEAAVRTGCRVTAVTVSEAQYEYATQRVEREGLADRVTIALCDYRDVTGQFDRIVSIEMLEAVGPQFLSRFFSTCDRLLKPDGLLVVQVITTPDRRYQQSSTVCDWIQKHIFPGGVLPSLGSISAAMTAGSEFYIDHVENIGVHYAPTLRVWRERFLDQVDRVRDLGFDAEFQRKWLYYLSSCEAAFSARYTNDLQLVLSRINNANLDDIGVRG